MNASLQSFKQVRANFVVQLRACFQHQGPVPRYHQLIAFCPLKSHFSSALSKPQSLPLSQARLEISQLLF